VNDEEYCAIRDLRFSFYFSWHRGRPVYEAPPKSNEIERNEAEHGISDEDEKNDVLKHFEESVNVN